MTAMHDHLRSKAQEGKSTWPILGFDGDGCVYDLAFETRLVMSMDGDTARLKGVSWDLFLATLRDEPIAYGRTILTRIEAFLSSSLPPLNPVFTIAVWPDGPEHRIARMLPPTVPAARLPLAPHQVELLPSLPYFLTDPVFTAIRWTFPIVVLLSVAAATRHRLFLVPLATVLRLLASAVVLVGAVHTVDIDRYATVLDPFVLLAYFAAAASLVALVPGIRTAGQCQEGKRQLQKAAG